MNKKRLILLVFSMFVMLKLSAQESLETFFTKNEVSGSITIFDYKNNQWIYSDSTNALVETLPASTFKILNSLIALETKAIKNENEIFKWNGIDHSFLGSKMPQWNKDSSLKTAYKNSTIWFYEELAKRIGKNVYKETLAKINYGNLNFNEKGDDFWNYGEFEISPKNQVEFLIKLYENELPFSIENINIVKNIMISEENEIGIFRDKTGWAQKDKMNIGWWIGYVTTKDNVYFFATRIVSPIDSTKKNFSALRKKITIDILKELNFTN